MTMAIVRIHVGMTVLTPQGPATVMGWGDPFGPMEPHVKVVYPQWDCAVRYLYENEIMPEEGCAELRIPLSNPVVSPTQGE